MIGQTSIIPNIRIVSNHSIILDKAEISELELETAKTLHNPKLNYSLGIDFTHQLNDKLSIRAGLAFQDTVDVLEYQSTIFQGTHIYTLDVSNYPQGVYTICLTINDKKITKRLIVIK